MINKYQQGGSVIQQLQQLPKEQQEQIMQAFAQWAQEKGIDIQQIQQDTNSLEQALVQFIQETQQQQVQAAKHGAKLKYVKSLKNMCEEDEELYYYKKGGSLGCGCRKKENGGEIKKAEQGAVARFKEDYKKQQNKTSISPNDTVHIQNPKTKKMEVRDLSGKHKQYKPLTKEEYQKQSNSKKNDIDLKGYKKGGKTEKDCGGSKIKFQKKGGEVCPKCGKVHAAGMGCDVAKFKKHQQGGKTLWNYRSPEIKNKGEKNIYEESSFTSDPDKFGRTATIYQRIYPDEKGSFNNDTIYNAVIHTPYSSYGTWGSKSNMTPKNVMNKPFNNWRDYFNYLYRLKQHK